MRILRHELLKRRRTKIVATVGPTSSDAPMLERLIKAGVNVFRLNMSHGDHDFHGSVHRRIRSIAQGLDEPVATMADLCGPKMRVGCFADGKIQLEAGSRVTVTTRDVVGGPALIPSQYAALAGDVYPGDRILINDGLLELQVEDVEGSEIQCSVVHGGELKDRKGINLPGVDVSAPSLTEKDLEDAQFAMELGVDFLALSFVRRAEHVTQLKSIVKEAGSGAKVIAKIEMPDAVEAIGEILDVADGIMVARGDLGVELPIEVVPIVQRHLVAQARAKNKLSIVATQMLESMIEHPRPTRAEVSDVSSAVFAGADAVMLSAETASGSHPLEAVAMMDRIARQVEGCLWSEDGFRSISERDIPELPLPLQPAIGRAIAQLSRDLRVRAIVVVSQSGATADFVASARPAAPIVAATAAIETSRRMNLLWGVVPMYVENPPAVHDLARQLVRQLGLAEDGQYVLVLTGVGDNRGKESPTIALTALMV